MNEKSATGSAVKAVGQSRARIRKSAGKMAPKSDRDPLAKIVDTRLRELAQMGSSERVTVLVELDLPVQVVEYRRAGSRTHFGIAPFRVKAETAAQRRLLNKRVSEASQVLGKVAVTPPLWLKSSRVFVVDATGADVGELAKSSLFRAIRPNRVLSK